MNYGAILNGYPNSLGKNLTETVQFLSKPELKDAFRGFYLLPTVFNSDIDGGYSVITYDLCDGLATEGDLKALKAMDYDLVFDFILNHVSVLSPQFRDIIKKGDDSIYRDFFIDWNKFWAGCGELEEDGCVHPYADKFEGLTLRRNGLPVLMIRFPDGREVPYWNTFYQKVFYRKVDEFDLIDLVGGQYSTAVALSNHINRQLDEGKTPETFDWEGYEPFQEAVSNLMEDRRRYLGQMDVNVHSPLVWEWYEEVLDKLASHGASIIRLDAFTGLYKEPGRNRTKDKPETWQLLKKVKGMAAERGLDVLPEIHESRASNVCEILWNMDCTFYDYFLPLMLLDAMETGETQFLDSWAQEQIDRNVRSVNMLGCHDGIPIRDPRGALPDDRVDKMGEIILGRGGRKKCVQTGTFEMYQVDVTYYSALGCDDRKMTMARAVQMFMPGRPQIWYMDLLAGANDLTVFEREPDADNREINRRRYTLEESCEELKRPVVAEQLRLLRFRNTHPAFAEDSVIQVEQPSDSTLRLTWRKGDAWAQLYADMQAMNYEITCSDYE